MKIIKRQTLELPTDKANITVSITEKEIRLNSLTASQKWLLMGFIMSYLSKAESEEFMHAVKGG